MQLAIPHCKDIPINQMHLTYQEPLQSHSKFENCIRHLGLKFTFRFFTRILEMIETILELVVSPFQLMRNNVFRCICVCPRYCNP